MLRFILALPVIINLHGKPQCNFFHQHISHPHSGNIKRITAPIHKLGHQKPSTYLKWNNTWARLKTGRCSPESEATLHPRDPHWPDGGLVLPCTLRSQPSISTPVIIVEQLAVRRYSEHGHGFEWLQTGQKQDRQMMAAGPRWGVLYSQGMRM